MPAPWHFSRFVLCAALLVAPAAHAGRVVSLNLCTDQLLVLLAPEQVLALEPLARDPSLSFAASQAAHLPSVRADAEAVLRLHPDLVLAGQYGAQTTVALLRAHGLHVVQFAEPSDFAGISRETAQIAALLGEEARGRALMARMWQRLSAVRKRPGRAVLWEAAGWSSGPGSLGDTVLRQAGFTDIGTGGRIGLEALLAARPDVLVTESAPRFPSLSTSLAWHPALRGIRHLTVPPPLLICGGPFTAGAVESLTR